MPSALPKLSYLLTSHNREKYIRQAIESAFAQEYDGELEYIFSDDCSTDRTYEIIKECAASYKGARRVVVTQTPRNLHLAGNTNHAVQFVQSDWIIRADDDDYSSIDRCALIGQAIAAHPEARYVTTGVEHFTDAQEAVILEKSFSRCLIKPEMKETRIDVDSLEDIKFRPASLSYKAWHMEVFRVFGPLHEQGYFVDDLTCFYRASVLGSGVHIHNYTAVFMRDGSENMSRGGDDNQRGYSATIRLEKFNDKYHNLTYSPLLQEQASLVEYILEHHQQGTELFMEYIANDMKERRLLRSFWRKGILNRIKISAKLGYHGAFALLRCLPMPLFAFLLSLYRKFK